VSDKKKSETGEKDKEELAEGTLLSHLVELRGRLLKVAAAVIVVFIGL
jgi:Sec-independent protein secretion pathway component TatC